MINVQLKVAIIIPVRNEESSIEDLLKNLVAQLDSGDEIIVVDAGSVDQSIVILEQFARHQTQVKVLFLKNAFPGAARNAGIRQAQADLILQIDAGNKPSPDWVYCMKQVFAEPSVDYVVGNIAIMPIDRNFFGIQINFGDIFAVSLFGQTRQPTVLYGGSNVGYRKWVWEKIGGFCEQLRSGEDLIFAFKASKLILKHIFLDQAVVYWQIGPHWYHVLRRQVQYQKAKFIFPKNILKSKGSILLPLGFLGLMAISLWHPVYFMPTVGTILLYWIWRIYRVSDNYLRYTHACPFSIAFILALIILSIMEFLKIFCRMLGTVLGLLSASKNRIHIE